MLTKIEGEQIDYIVATKMNKGLVRRIFEQKAWFPQDDGYWTSSFQYKAHGWDAPRRVVVVRKDARKHPSTGGKLLFPEIEEFEKYKYAAFVTNIDLSDELIWQLYTISGLIARTESVSCGTITASMGSVWMISMQLKRLFGGQWLPIIS